ncbi:unnamed protein product [Choristocarpus tenellus]
MKSILHEIYLACASCVPRAFSTFQGGRSGPLSQQSPVAYFANSASGGSAQQQGPPMALYNRLDPAVEGTTPYASMTTIGHPLSGSGGNGATRRYSLGEKGSSGMQHASRIGNLCRHNSKAAAALAAKKGKLALTWTLLAEIADDTEYLILEGEQTRMDQLSSGQAQRYAGCLSSKKGERVRQARSKRLVNKILHHYDKQWDVQTLATVTCVLGSGLDPIVTCMTTLPTTLSVNGSTSTPTSTSQQSAKPSTPCQGETREGDSQGWEGRGQLLTVDRKTSMRFDRYLTSYADLLYSWGAYNVRLEVLQHLPRRSQGERIRKPPVESHSTIETGDNSTSTGKQIRTDGTVTQSRLPAPRLENACKEVGQCSCPVYGETMYCSSCGGGSRITHLQMLLARFGSSCSDSTQGGGASSQNVVMCCSVCQVPVRRISIFCNSCGHGGHAAHIQGWFEEHVVCPAGCGCRCLEAALHEPTDTDHVGVEGMVGRLTSEGIMKQGVGPVPSLEPWLDPLCRPIT